VRETPSGMKRRRFWSSSARAASPEVREKSQPWVRSEPPGRRVK